MICTFENYLNEPYILAFHQMQTLHRKLLNGIECNPDALELYEDLVDAATKYAVIRAKQLKMQGKNAAWRDQLSDDTCNKYYRKTIGDFGCYIVFINNICAR